MRRFIRVWEELDLADVEKHLIVAGDLSAECFCCHKVGIDLKARACPNCSASIAAMAKSEVDPFPSWSWNLLGYFKKYK